MSQIGNRTFKGTGDTFLYIEDASSNSSSVGMDGATGSFCVNVDNAINASPAAASAQISIDSAANGNVTIRPDGSGGLVLTPSTQHSVLVGGGSSSPVTYTAVGATGQVLTGVSGSDPVWAAAAVGSNSYQTDSGAATPAAGVITIHGTHNINTTGAGSTVTVQNNNTATFGDLSVVGINTASMTLTSGDLLISGTGVGAGGNINFPATTGANVGVIEQNGTAFIHSLGTSNAFLGANAGGFGVNAANNVGIGTNALGSQGGGFGGNTMVGAGSGSLITAGDSNTGLGASTLAALGLGQYNEAIGYLAGRFMPSGDNNTMIGYRAGENYTGSEDSNILIRNFGVNAEQHTMRLGTSGSTDGQVNRTFIAGVDGVNVGSVAKVVTMASDQVGTATITAGTGISVTPGANTITIAQTASPASACYFVAYLASSVTNATGDATPYDIIMGSTVANVGSNYNTGTGTFSAPNTGLYHFDCAVTVNNLIVGHTSAQIVLQGSVNQYSPVIVNPYIVQNASGNVNLTGSITIPMTAGDTMKLRITVSGSTKTVTVYGQALTGVYTYLTGYQVA